MSRASGVGRPGVDRTVLLTLLVLLAALCWACLLFLLFRAGRMSPLEGGAGTHVRVGPYHADDLARLLALWTVVIAAMMLPAAAPSVLLYARVKRLVRERWVYPSTLLFMLGYLFV
jgi:predicted metal-binding membrane protein